MDCNKHKKEIKRMKIEMGMLEEKVDYYRRLFCTTTVALVGLGALSVVNTAAIVLLLRGI